MCFTYIRKSHFNILHVREKQPQRPVETGENMFGKEDYLKKKKNAPSLVFPAKKN